MSRAHEQGTQALSSGSGTALYFISGVVNPHKHFDSLTCTVVMAVQDSHCAGKSIDAAKHREAAAIHSALVSSIITGFNIIKEKTKTKPASIKSLYGTKARLLIMF